MGNTASGQRRRASLDDDSLRYDTNRRVMQQFSQDSNFDNSVINIMTDDQPVNVICDQLRDSKICDASGKPTLYVGTPGGCPDGCEGTHSVKDVPTVFKWSGLGKDVYISGTFNGWKAKIPMVRSSSKHSFYTIIDLPLGEHQYKFIVDGHWKLDHNQPIHTSANGVQNNVIEVRESDFDVLSALSHDIANSRGAATEENAINFSSITPTQPYFEPVDIGDSPYASGTGSPPGEYSRMIPASPTEALSMIPSGGATAGQTQSTSSTSSSDVKKLLTPPLLPPQLLQVILNRDTNVQCDPNLLPQPDHVMVNHMYALSIKDGVIVLSAITRYRQKFVSTVLYKPI